MRPSRNSAASRVHHALEGARARLAARDRAIVGMQVAISEIAAPTGEESQRAAWIATRFRALGLRNVRTDRAGNVIARRDGLSHDPPVVVCAHLDTVFPRDTALHVRADGDRLIGPGIGDNGRGLAAMLAIAEEIDGVQLCTRRAVEFVATTGEEGTGDLRGAKHFFRAGDSAASAVIALDGAGDERVVHRALGSRRYRVTFHGPGGHSWAAHGVPHPVHAAGCCVAALARLRLPTDPRTTLSVGRIGGGISINAIPDDGWLEIDLRSTSASTLDRLDPQIRHIIAAATDEENGRRATGTVALSATVEVIGERPCGETPADHPLVVSAIDATRLVGRQPDLAAASTDANVPISLGIPAIAIGAGGRGGDAHTPSEWFDNTDGPLGIARALTIVAGAAELEA